MNLLEIKNLHAETNGKEILKGINLTIKKNEVHAIMGPNGSGKSTLSNTLAGHPEYNPTKGTAKMLGKNLFKMTPDERAKNGLFLAFQNPPEISGVKMSTFLRTAINEKKNHQKKEPITLKEFKKKLEQKSNELQIKHAQKRNLNEGFSGGEKKKSETLQMKLLEPKIIILDEIDSGLDIDALKTVSKQINTMKKKDTGILIITHYSRILEHIKPNFVHIQLNGKIIQSGTHKLAQKINKHGYSTLNNGE
jgi:Fe-S cluster assembly ATP-binding protein